MTGVAPGRVMLITARTANGRSVGSGTLVGRSLVLTAAHVVFDDNGQPARNVKVGGVDVADVAAKVIWPAAYPLDAADSEQLDAALVELTDPCWVPPQLGAVRWGWLTGSRPGVRCEATGFPRALAADGVRDTDQVSAEINPGSRRVAGRYDLKVLSAVPTPQRRDRPSLWGGLSGAGVFAGGLLIAVVIIDERGSYSGDRLSAVPVYRLASDAQFVALVSDAGGGLTGSRQLESVELAGVLTPLHRRASRRRHPALSPATLLRPEEGVVPFHGRRELTDALIGWCQDRELAVGIRLLIGPGGQGKTRMGRQLADHMLRLPPEGGAGWVCGLLRAGAGEQDLAVIADTVAPLLVLVDYAETRTQQLRRLLPLLWDADTSRPVRVLLLARGAGDWWARLSRELDGAPGDIIALGGLDPVEDRAAQFAAAVTAFASHLDDRPPADAAAPAALVAPPPDLGQDRYGSPLTLQMAALTALLETRQPLAPAAGRAPAEETVLRHEERYWNDTAQSAGLDLSLPILRRVVAAATLCGAGSFDDVTTLAGSVPGSGDLTQDQLQRLDTWLSGLYPPEPGQRWGSLQPDRLGEYLIATTLPDQTGLIAALLTAADAARQHRALTILARAMANRALTEPQTIQLSTQVREALAADLAGLGAAAVQVITETADPRAMLTAIHDVAEQADETGLRQLVDALPASSLSLADLAAQWTTRQVSLLRARATAAADPDTVTPDLASALNKQSLRLADLGRREEALTASSDALDIYRELATAHPDAFIPDLAMALNNQSNRLGALGRDEDALTAITEAVKIRRELATADPDAFTPELAGSLVNQSGRLGAVGRDKALAASTEAVTIYRRLATARPDAFGPRLAGSLNNQCNRLSDLGRDEDALNAITEAVKILRRLATARPDAFSRDLAIALINHSNQLAAVDRDKALAANTEAVKILRRLATARPDPFTPDLAGSLSNQSLRLGAAGRRQDALNAITEATEIYHQLASRYPAYMPNVARSLIHQGVLRTELDDLEGALSVDREAVSLYAALLSVDAALYRDEFEQVIQNLVIDLRNVGRTEQQIADELDRLPLPGAFDAPAILLSLRDDGPRLVEEPIRDFEPDDQLVGATAPPAGGVGTIQRIPHIDVGEYADAAITVGTSFSVSVYADTEDLHPGEQGAPIILPERRELRLAVILTTSAHFTVDGDGRGEIVVRPGEQRSSAADFTLICKSADEPQAGVAATFYLDWRPVGSVSRQLTVGPGSAVAPHLLQPTATATGGLAIHEDHASPPDLSITISRAPDGDERHYTVTVSSPHLTRLTAPITVPWNLPMATREMVEGMMTTFLTTDPGGRKAALIGSGRRLFDATPAEFRSAFWDLIDYSAANNVPFETIYVVTDEPYIPWELMVPKRDGTLRPALGVEFAVGRWVHPNLVSPVQTVPITDSWVIAPEYPAPDTLKFSAGEAQFVIDTFNGKRLTPARLLSIDEKLGARGASLLHFICHGTSEPTVQILELEPDERLTDNQIEGLPGLARAFAEHQPFVFINACQVGQINPALVGSTGFAAVFSGMGARGVIAPIWSVDDSVAAQVARQFYTRIKADPTLPYAKAMQEIRKLAYEGQDPEDSYAAYCFYGDPKAAQARPA